eukprot:CAMPEP_0204316762 /NCGR_PEP_ID=MMETSP0469-20131031/5580_1 /ASSEMBLY_ACC=CAM_ASM_000384 /TAXON_ID=2969 /ORGANISM="Oxyrrhis marina" /LENGTH=81 /DNA_ID=CAMNT_0051297579 /DNA_START=186 /DNA_END=431 /DNA_ORIENTATION=+
MTHSFTRENRELGVAPVSASQARFSRARRVWSAHQTGHAEGQQDPEHCGLFPLFFCPPRARVLRDPIPILRFGFGPAVGAA